MVNKSIVIIIIYISISLSLYIYIYMLAKYITYISDEFNSTIELMNMNKNKEYYAYVHTLLILEVFCNLTNGRRTCPRQG